MRSPGDGRERSGRALSRGFRAPGSTRRRRKGLRSRPGAATEPPAESRAPVVVLGAGDYGKRTIDALRRDPLDRYEPVALIDDDPARKRTVVDGIPVVGPRSAMVDAIRRSAAQLVVIAIPSASSSLVQAVDRQLGSLGIDIRLLPPTHEIGDDVHIDDIRPVQRADLIGRRAVETDGDGIRRCLRGRTVLVTGAGGSIGSELCRQISTYGPSKLLMLDRDESALHRLHLSLHGSGITDRRSVVIADTRDGSRIDQVFNEHSPDVVFHTAALKNLALLEMHPEEGWKTNVEGTNHLLRASARVGVRHFVNLSSDKATDPISILGYTKRLGERLTAWYAHRIRGEWVSVRLGNVLGSRSSVFGTFETQIATGGPVTVTHPDATRYFMTAAGASRLILQAGAVGDRGEALVLDMGQPVRILDVAERMIADSGNDVDIRFTGLRNGEKVHEAPVSQGELDIRRAHPLISHVSVPALNPSELGRFDRATPRTVRDSIVELCDSEHRISSPAA